MKNITKVRLEKVHIDICQTLSKNAGLQLKYTIPALAHLGISPSELQHLPETQLIDVRNFISQKINEKVQARWNELRKEVNLPECDVPSQCLRPIE
tara:strand:- start:210 stop:497 length:288 start_codon:yes stop_codon:yes gene_type:complete